MATALTKFEIALDSPDREFSSGEIVSGKVIVELGRMKKIRGIKVRIKGTAEVKWSEDTGSESGQTTYTNSEQYLRKEFYVVGGNGNIEIEPGRHVYPFNFSLPRNIPSSFESKHGNVCYTIKATIDRPWKFDHQTKVPFTVVTPLDLSQFPAARIPIEDFEVETFCCFPCITVGTMRVRFYMPTSGFAVGEALKAKIDIDNNSTSVDVERIRLKLEQIIKLDGRSKKKTIKNAIKEAIKTGPFDKNEEIKMNMRIPLLPSSNLLFCNIIDIWYRIIVKISVSDCHCSMEKSYPIVIGTRQALNCQPTVSVVLPEVVENFSSLRAPNAQFFDEDTSLHKNTIPSCLPMITLNFNEQIPVGVCPMEENYPPPATRISDPGSQYFPSMGGPPIGYIDPNSRGSVTGSTEDTSIPKDTIPFFMNDLNFNDPIPVGASPNGEIYPSPTPTISIPGFPYSPSMDVPSTEHVDPNSRASISRITEEPPPSYEDCMKMTKSG